MLHGTPSRNGITRTRSHRATKNASAAALVVGVDDPADEVAAAVEAVAGVPGPDHTGAPVERARGRAQRGVRSTGTTVDGARVAADGVPDLVGDQLVLQGGPAAGRPPSTGRPSMGAVPMNGPTSHTASRAGS